MKRLFVLAMVAGCATPNIKRDAVGFSFTSDDRLSHYVKSFLADCRAYLSEKTCSPPIELRVIVNALPDNILGQCTVYESKLRTIELDDTVLNQYNERAVIYHELFHCVMNKPHHDGELDIMNAYEVDENTLYMYAHWPYYVGKVFLRE